MNGTLGPGVSTTVKDFGTGFHETGIFGRHEFLQTLPWAAFPTIVLLTVASFIGTSGNVLTLLAIASNKKVRNVESMFIVNLAMSDLYVTTVADPVSIIAKLEGEHFLDRTPKLCMVIAKLCTISCVTSLLTIATMSLNRYIYVCHNSYYKKIFSKRNSVIICMSVYCVGLVLVLLNQAGIGDHGFDRKSLDCIWDRMATYPYTVVYSVTLVWIPCVVIGICYLRLYFFVQSHKKKLLNHQKRNTVNSPVPAPPPRPKMQLAKTFILIYAVFVICWAPYALLIVIDHQDAIIHEVHVFLTVWAHMHPSMNWLIYYFTQPKFKVAYRRILACGSQQIPSNIRSPRSAQNSREEQPMERHPSEILKVYRPSSKSQGTGDVVDMEWKPIGKEKSELSSINTDILSNNNVGIYRKLFDEIRNIHSEGEIQIYVRDSPIKRESFAKLRETHSVDLVDPKRASQRRNGQGSVMLMDGVKELNERSSAVIELIDKVCDSQALVEKYALSNENVNNCKTCEEIYTGKSETSVENLSKDTGENENSCKENYGSPSPTRSLSSIDVNMLDGKTNSETCEMDPGKELQFSQMSETDNIANEITESFQCVSNSQSPCNESRKETMSDEMLKNDESAKRDVG